MNRVGGGSQHGTRDLDELGMQRQLTAFVEDPCQATFLAARDVVLRRSALPIVASDVADLDRLLVEKDFAGLLDRIDALPPSKILSPRIHFLAAEAAEALGDSAAVELERSLFVLTLQGLLTTGDGTRQRPYIVCHPTDEYDILAALGRKAAGQSLVEHEGRLCDVLHCADGCEVWFDVTDILIRPRRRKEPARRTPQRIARGDLRISRVQR